MKKMSDLFYECAYGGNYKSVGKDVNYKFIEDGSNLEIYFEGSHEKIDWFRNFFFFPIKRKPYKDMETPYRVHRGFLQAWKEVEDIIINKICEDDDNGSYKWKHITVVGYSHGGSLTFFTTECIWYWRPDLRDDRFKSYAFESPRVFGGFKIPKHLKERWKAMTVVRVGSDIVTHMPPVIFKFCHAETLLHLNGNYMLVDKKLPRCVKYHFPEVVYNALLLYEKDLLN